MNSITKEILEGEIKEIPDLLYHISIGLDSKEKLFTPRVPSETAGSEDKLIRRICFSETIEGCFCGIPRVYDRLCNNDFNFTIYKLDTRNIDRHYLVNNDEVYNFVDDAKLTKEWWYLDEIILKGEQYKLLNAEYDSKFIAHEHHRRHAYSWLESNGYNTKEFDKYDMLELVNSILYEEKYESTEFDTVPDEVADYCKMSNAMTIYNLKCEEITD